MDKADSARSEKLAWPIALLVQLRAFEALVGGMLVGALSAVFGAPWAASAMAIAGTPCMVAIFMTVPRARDIR